MEILLAFIWIIGSVIVGAIGSDRECGFFGPFALSLFLSPFVGVLFAFASMSKVEMEYKKSVLQLLRMIADREDI